MRRRCPVCKEYLDFSAIVLPGIRGGNNRVICRKCGSILSKPMGKYSWIGMLGLPFGLFLGDIEKFFGLSCEISCAVISVSLLIALFVVGFYYLLPLSKQNHPQG